MRRDGALPDVLLDLLLAAMLLALVVARWAPPQDLPWTPLRLSDPVGLATAFKLDWVASDPGRCLAFLRREDVAFTPAPIVSASPGCGAPDGVRLARTVSRLEPGEPVMACALAARYLVWERAVAAPLAQRRLRSPLEAVEHVGTYACRPIAGTRTLSQHAQARAIDVTGVRLADGRRVTVSRDWSGDGGAGRYLHAVRSGACGLFRGVLSPDYNAAHATHLHLDAGPYRVCG